ncbi:hypothetical protein OMK73_30685 [Cupriavidus sp. D39]|nr:hypothetical protein [Cupriavidus sp. D39]MCY0857545.1 hypothetical protein [Cupriavidus sp. D39]
MARFYLTTEVQQPGAKHSAPYCVPSMGYCKLACQREHRKRLTVPINNKVHFTKAEYCLQRVAKDVTAKELTEGFNQTMLRAGAVLVLVNKYSVVGGLQHASDGAGFHKLGASMVSD